MAILSSSTLHPQPHSTFASLHADCVLRPSRWASCGIQPLAHCDPGSGPEHLPTALLLLQPLRKSVCFPQIPLALSQHSCRRDTIKLGVRYRHSFDWFLKSNSVSHWNAGLVLLMFNSISNDYLSQEEQTPRSRPQWATLDLSSHPSLAHMLILSAKLWVYAD